MHVKLLMVAAGVVVTVATTAAAQEAIGPVTPRPAGPVESFEKTLQGLMRTDVQSSVWKGADSAKLEQFIERIDSLRSAIKGIAIGPVTPKPQPTPLGSTPPKPPRPKPSQQSLQESLKGLLGELGDARAKKPGMTLPDSNASDLQGILDALSKGQLP